MRLLVGARSLYEDVDGNRYSYISSRPDRVRRWNSEREHWEDYPGASEALKLELRLASHILKGI